MYLGLGRLLCKQHKLLNFIVIAQLAVALLIGNILVGNYNKSAEPIAFLSAFDDDAAFFSPLTIAGKPKADIDYNLLSGEGTTIEFLPKKAETMFFDVFCYGQKTCEVLKKQLRKGQWTPNDNDNEIACVTIGNGYDIGESFSAQIKGVSFSFKVVGTLGRKAMLINSSRNSSYMRADTLLAEYDSAKSGTAVVCCSKELAAHVGTYGNAMVFDVSSNAAQHLGNNGKLTSARQMRDNSVEDLKLSVQSYLPLAICFGACGFLSVVSMTCLNLLKDKKVYDVYFVCGMNKKDAFGINFGYMVWIIACVVVMTLALYVLCALAGIVNSSVYLVKPNQFILSAAYLLLLVVVASVLSLTVIKQRNISES